MAAARALARQLTPLVLVLAAWLAPVSPAAAGPAPAPAPSTTPAPAVAPVGVVAPDGESDEEQALPPDVKKRRRIEAKQRNGTTMSSSGSSSGAPDTAASRPRADSRPDVDARRDARWHQRLQARVGKPAAPVINIFNTWTHEYLPVAGAAEIDQATANRFFRCHFTGEPTKMDPRLLASLVAAARHFGVRDVHIVSAFRAPKYNLMLRKKGREVARDSRHSQGSAVDFRLPGVPVQRLHDWATQQRLGGVGLYTGSGFIHMDTGRIRAWNGR
jgi:uncharacterized protein YcbK (DUF882 family)